MSADGGSLDNVRIVGASISKTSLAGVVLECDVGVLVLLIGVLPQPVSVEGGRARELDVATLPSTHLAIRLESLFT